MNDNESENKIGTTHYTVYIGTLLLAAQLFVGCASPGAFGKFYTDTPQRIGTNSSRLMPYSGNSQILQMANPDADIKRLYRQGYVMIGQSNFEISGNVDQSALLAQAKKVGADIVLYRTDYLGSHPGVKPVLQYEPGQTYTTTSSGTVNATAYGSGGYAYGTGNYSGTSTTTTPGTLYTQMVPVTLHRYAHHAIFWRKTKPPALGAIVHPLSDDLKAKLQRNGGVVVAVVLDDSPAFRANILEGDILLKIAGQEISSPGDYIEKARSFAGQKVDIEILRSGETKTISIQLNAQDLPPPAQAK
jgi:serine protease Do